jgi:hypothetical protein
MAADARTPESLAASLIGTWDLVSREDRTPSGELRIDPALGPDPVALLYYDRSGHFAAQFMKRQRDAATVCEPARSGPNNSRARGGYDAYFGTYAVDDATGIVTQRLVGALSPENVGMVVTRAMTVTGDALVLHLETTTTAGEPVVRTLKWRRAGSAARDH